MTIILTQAVRIAGTTQPIGTQLTLEGGAEGDLVHRGCATYVTDPHSGEGDTTVRATTNPLTGGIEGMSVSGTKLGAISAITYNADGTLHTYTQDAVLWTCAYDSSGRLSTETSTGTVKTYSYNADGTLASVTVV